MSFSFSKSILPMSDLRADPEKVKKLLDESPVLITNKGRPDFGICDLDTLEIAIQVKQLKDTLKRRLTDKSPTRDAKSVFAELDKKHGIS